MARQPIKIDRDKLRAAVRKLKREYLFYMLDDAIDLLPSTELHKIASKYFDPALLQRDSAKGAKANVFADVQAFEKASLAGEYYESFGVNSKNFMDISTGTTAWIAECLRLLDRCVSQEKKGDPGKMRAAFDIIFGLLDRIDKGNDDVIFFADEGG